MRSAQVNTEKPVSGGDTICAQDQRAGSHLGCGGRGVPPEEGRV